MSSLLKIDVSPRGDFSVSRRLGAQFLVEFQAAHPGAAVVTRDLAETDIPFVSLPWISGAHTPEEARNDEQRSALKRSDEFLAELDAADHVLITLPFYNFNIPARLKAWIDHIVRAGRTFRVNPDGSYTGLLKDKKVTVIIAYAGGYAAGLPTEPLNYAKPYLQFILGFIGLTDVTVIDAFGTYVLNSGKTTVEQLIEPLAGQVKAAAAL